jgi:hypothetical protein
VWQLPALIWYGHCSIKDLIEFATQQKQFNDETNSKDHYLIGCSPCFFWMAVGGRKCRALMQFAGFMLFTCLYKLEAMCINLCDVAYSVTTFPINHNPMLYPARQPWLLSLIMATDPMFAVLYNSMSLFLRVLLAFFLTSLATRLHESPLMCACSSTALTFWGSFYNLQSEASTSIAI